MNRNKIIGKRQMQRRIKSNYKAAIKQLADRNDGSSNTSNFFKPTSNPHNGSPEGFPFNNFMLDTCSISTSNLSSTASLSTKLISESEIVKQTVSANTFISTASPINQYSETLNNVSENNQITTQNAVYMQDVIDNNLTLQNNLRQWVIKHGPTANSVSELLHILQPVVENLPLDYRTLMQTPRNTQNIILNNGKMFYTGIEAKLKHKLMFGFNNNTHQIDLQINIDGLPLFKSSGTEIWPILGMCPALADRQPFAIGIFCGFGKPDPLELFLENFINEVNHLKVNNIIYNDKIYKFNIHFFICDAPARAFLRMTLGHTSKKGCERCFIVGKKEQHCINFASRNVISYPKKIDADFTSSYLGEDINYIKGRSPLLEIGLKLVTQFPLDPMHLFYLGVVKRLLINYLLEGKGSFRLSQSLKRKIDSKISTLRGHIPSEFVRKQRDLKEVKKWKATEFRSFILYNGVILLHDVLNSNYYKHFLLLHCATFIISNSLLIEQYLDMAEIFLQQFVVDAPKLYDNDFVVFNVHSLLHVCDDVRLYGSINHYSCFPFENFLATLKKKVHSKNHPLEQIYRRIEECEICPSVSYSSENNVPIKAKKLFNEEYDSTSLLISYYCKKLILQNYVLTDSKPDNCVILKSKKQICVIKSIRYVRDHYLFEGCAFRYRYNLYDSPIESSKLSIYYVNNLDEANAIAFQFEDIFAKSFLLPYKNGFAVFPLNHCI